MQENETGYEIVPEVMGNELDRDKGETGDHRCH